MARKKFNHKQHGHVPSMLDIFKRWLSNKIAAAESHKSLAYEEGEPLVRISPRNIHVYHIAVVLDNKVQEIVRADSKMAALFLSEPIFVEFDPALEAVDIGTDYVDGKLVAAAREASEEGHTHV